MHLRQMIPEVPEVSRGELDRRAAEFHEAEREALQALGIATLRGLRGEAAREELRRIREELDATHAAARLLELLPPPPEF